jgi:hypothetical protein
MRAAETTFPDLGQVPDLETMRRALYRESIAFLEGDDEAPGDARRCP